MKKYRRKTTQWQQKDNEEKQMNKTEFIKVRCTLEEKQRIKEPHQDKGRVMGADNQEPFHMCQGSI